MNEFERNDYLRRALQSAGGQFSELSLSHQGEEVADLGTFLTDRPLTPRPEGAGPTVPDASDPAATEAKIMESLNRIKGQKASKLVTEACSALKASQYSVAMAKLSRAIQMNGDVASYYMLRGEVALQLCEFKEAIVNYEHATELQEDGGWQDRLSFIHFITSQSLCNEQDFEGALEHANHALRLNPDKFIYKVRKAAYLFALEEHRECLQYVETLISDHDDIADLFILRGRLNKLFGYITKCFYDVHRALELEPDNTQAQAIVDGLSASAEECRASAVNQALAGNIAEAINKITISIDTNPTLPEYTIFRGTLLRQQTHYDRAIDDFMDALTKVPENSKPYKDAFRQLVLTYNDFAVECYMKGYYEEAISLLDQAIKRERGEKGFYINRGDCFRMTGHLAFALADYQQALEIDPQDWITISRISLVHHEYGVAEYTGKRYAAAEKCFTTAITCNSKVAQYYLSRAWARFMQKQLPAARADLLRALFLDRGMEEGTMLAARLYPNQHIDSILSARSSQKILSQMAELMESPGGGGLGDEVLSSNTLAHEPIAAGRVQQYSSWIDNYRASNNTVRSVLDSRPTLERKVPGLLDQSKVRHDAETRWMRKHFDSSSRCNTVK